ncbi:hypothetical protein DPMN_132274 [Dreissena polymorpha]|uniref:Uncharacterized protein n=1 Tax=Dreissena polymorpha TaxID=45954 RepID=A0A9D4FTI5_DREPO|nr:hypothetical protein DPMN_132274 [Dreissena polymorpha]
MRNATLLKGSGIFLNEDLTKLNAEVLASVRWKDPENVQRAWSFEGKLYARFKAKTTLTELTTNIFKRGSTNHGRRQSVHSRMPAGPQLTRFDAVIKNYLSLFDFTHSKCIHL